MRHLIPSLLRNRNRRRGRSGQALVDYALLTAFISMTVVQEMHYLGEIVDCQMINSNASFVVADTVAHHADLSGKDLDNACAKAVHDYLTTTSTWNGIDPSLASTEAARIYQNIYTGIFGQPDPNGGSEY